MVTKVAALLAVLVIGVFIGLGVGHILNSNDDMADVDTNVTAAETTLEAIQEIVSETLPLIEAVTESEPETEPETEPPLPPALSPTDLQLAMFAHMAFFPFNFNGGDRPTSQHFTPMHYAPFVDRIMTGNINAPNVYGFTFAEKIDGWHLSRTHTDRRTGFSFTLYTCEHYRTVVIAIRGSYGDMDRAIVGQTGTWWYNFRSLGGHEHSHVRSMVSFLTLPSIQQILEGAHIYITGHSLGGYLAYIAAYEIANMGLEQNIRRVVAFSAPIFSQDTVDKVSTLSAATRRRMVHYYVEGDLIAGAVGVERGPVPDGYGVFDLIGNLFYTLHSDRGIEIPETVNVLNTLLAMLGSLVPVNLPPHIAELVWMLDGAMSQEAQDITQQFSRLVRHQTVSQTWFTPRPEPSWVMTASPLEIFFNYSPELLMELMTETMLSIFDADTHFMMNFYNFLSRG